MSTRSRRLTRSFSGTAAIVATLLASLGRPEGASAQLVVPIPPREQPPVDAVELHLQLALPVGPSPLCPPGSECVFGTGGGIGGKFERRLPSGLALGLGYDAWFVDASSVWELGLMHAIRAEIRKLFMRRRLIHPFVGASVDFLLFGSWRQPQTIGLGLDAIVGLEIELTEQYSVVLAVPWRFMSFAPSFRTSHDGVRRASDLTPTVAFAVQAGFSAIDVF